MKQVVLKLARSGRIVLQPTSHQSAAVVHFDIDIEKAKRFIYNQLAAEALRRMKADGVIAAQGVYAK